MLWIEFLISSAVIIFCGTQLTKYADQISDHLQLGKAWVGIVLLGLVTSLPEAITCIVSIVSLNANDLAVGNLLGSNNFNPLLIVLMDIVYRRGSVTNAITSHRSHSISAVAAVILVLIVLGELYYYDSIGGTLQARIGGGNILIIALYFVFMKSLARAQTPVEAGLTNPVHNVGRVWLKLFLSAALVVVGAMVLANSADKIAESTGLGRTFVGSIFLALVTSLPEMVVTISAMKLGSFDLAIGNIFGSNMTNMFILALCDLLTPGPILSTVSSTHVITGGLSIAIVLVALVGINSNSKKTVFGIGIDSIIMSVLFFGGTYVLYLIR